jgi:PhzF family phenazine biosynthesis protein
MLQVRKNKDWYTLNFPAEPVRPFTPDIDLEAIFKVPIEQCYKGKWKLMVLIPSEEDLLGMQPDFHLMQKLEEDGIIVTAKGNSVDFVSRFFVPKLGINEDPVTGSAHTLLIPYWADRLGKDTLSAQQLSDRRGILRCQNLGDRVEMSGQAVTYLKGKLTI